MRKLRKVQKARHAKRINCLNNRVIVRNGKFKIYVCIYRLQTHQLVEKY